MKRKIFSTIALVLVSTAPLWAQPKPSEASSFFSNPLQLMLGSIALILLFVIYIMAKVARMAINKNMIAERKKRMNKNVVSAVAFLLFSLINKSSFAADANGTNLNSITASISKEALWISLSVIIIEIFIIAYLYRLIRRFSGFGEAKKSSFDWDKFLAKWHRSTPVESEGDIDLGHNYDGIRELDNPTPPWWRLAFALTILFAPVYLYRYHVAHSAPLQIEELEIAIKKGEADKKAYLATATNAIDETNVVLLEGGDLASGASIFAKNCVACHGNNGEGNAIGPNLTDPNWLHGGGIVNVFKSVKYGWPEKGMKSWQDDLSSYEMAQVASYVTSIQGTNPAGAKEPQGEIWSEEGGDVKAVDTEVVADSATAEM